MGMWHISIRGTGIHHNQNQPGDAEKLAAGFVKVLKDHGHSIAAASFVSGSDQDLQTTSSPTFLTHPVVTPSE